MLLGEPRDPEAYYRGLMAAFNVLAALEADRPRYKRDALRTLLHLLLEVEDRHPGTLPDGGFSQTMMLRQINDTAYQEVDPGLRASIAGILRGPGFICGGRPLRSDVVEDWSARLADGLARFIDEAKAS